MAEAHDTRGARRRALAAQRDADFFPLNDLPNDLLVSVFIAVGDLHWVRHTVPLVCRAWNELYLSKDASPLHETLEVYFEKEVERAKEERRRRVARPLTLAAARELASYSPVIHASRVISWAQGRSGSVRKLRVYAVYASVGHFGGLIDFSAEDLGALVAVVGPSLTDISIGPNLGKLCQRPFWDSLRDHVVPAGRLRSFTTWDIDADSFGSDVEPLGQLAGSLEELVLRTKCRPEDRGLPRFPESFCALKKLRRLVLSGHRRITAIPAGISSLKKLEDLDLSDCRLSSLPKELGELSALTKLNLRFNEHLGTALPTAEAFPAELGKMKSLRELKLRYCGLRTVPAFVGELESLESLDLCYNGNLQIGAPLDFLIEGCPRLRTILLFKRSYGVPWTPQSRAHLEAFEAKLRAKNPSAERRRLAGDDARGVPHSPAETPRLRMRQHGQHVSSGYEKSRAIIDVLARVLIAPWLFFVSMLLVEEKCCWDEPEGYQAPGWKRWLAKRAKKGKALRRALVRSTLRFLRALTGAAEALSLGRLQAQAAAAVVAARRSRRRSSGSEGGDGNEDDGEIDDDDDGGDARLVLRRFAEAGRDSYTLTLQAVIYYATLHVLSFFAIEKAIFAFRSDLERWVCRVGGVWHVTADGRRLPYTLPSAMDADFSTPGYNPGRGFPYGDGEEERRGGRSGGNDAAAAAASAPSSSSASVPPRRIPFARPDDPRNAHFASLVCKAVYEDSAVVADLVRHKWRMRLAGHGRVPAHWTKSHWVPDLVWLVAESERGVILSLKGADPLWQVNLRADPPLSKRPREGIVGAVHCGLWRGLHQAAPGAAPGTSVADLILETLRQTGAAGIPSSSSSSSSMSRASSSSSHQKPPLSRLSSKSGNSGGMGRRRRTGGDGDGESEGAESDDTANGGEGEVGGEGAPPAAAPAPALPAAKPIFLCGHSLGGGLAALLAAIIAGKHPDLSARVAGVLTFAAPRFGDEEFAKHFSELYRGRAFRYVHASDMVCKLPPGFGYGHHASERFITSFPTSRASASASGRILREEVDGPEVMNAAAKLEDRAAHAFHFVKLALAAAGLGGWFESSLAGGPLRWWWGVRRRRQEAGGGGGGGGGDLSSASSYSSSPQRARHGARHGGGGSSGLQGGQRRRQPFLRPTPSARLLNPSRSSASLGSSSSASASASASSSSSRGESRVRLALRWALLAVPGFSDHFLCEYERALRAEVVAAEADAAAEAEAAAEEALAASVMKIPPMMEARTNSGGGGAAVVDVRRGQAEEDEVAEAPLSLSPRLPFPAPPAVRTSAFAAAPAVAAVPPLSPYSASLRTAGSGSVTAALRVGVPSRQGSQQQQQQQQAQPKAVSPLAAAAALVREQLSRAFPSFI